MRHCTTTRKSVSFWSAALVVVTFFLAAWAGAKPKAPAILKLTIIDELTGQPIPARVEVLDKDGTAYIAQDGMLIGGD